MFFVFCFFFLSSLVWFFLWLPEQVLTLLFLLHRENGDFSILMKHITTDFGIGILAVSESVVLLVAAAYGLGFCICGVSNL